MLLSWRDDPEKSGVQNGLPGKGGLFYREEAEEGRRRRRRLQVFICYSEQYGSREGVLHRVVV